jgi:hypothetical protein
MSIQRRWVRPVAVGLVVVSLSVAGVAAAAGNRSATQTNYRGPARLTGSGDANRTGQVQANRPASSVSSGSIAHSHLPVKSNNPAFEQGGNSN